MDGEVDSRAQYTLSGVGTGQGPFTRPHFYSERIMWAWLGRGVMTACCIRQESKHVTALRHTVHGSSQTDNSGGT